MGSFVETFQGDFGSVEANNINKVNSKPILTYGSLIYLTFSEENLTEYYAYSEGLTKTKVLLKTKESFHREGSYMRGLFRIYPSFSHTEYSKAKGMFQEIMSGGDSQQLNKREIRPQIKKLIKGIDEEIAQNQDFYEKLKGTPVRYGQVIQLLHIGSQKYLSYDPESPSDLENDCLQIDLKYEISDFSCFRIQPSFKFQQEGQGYIYNDDVVYLMSIVDTGNRIFGDPYLHASKTIGALNKDNPNKENLEKKEINVSSDKKTPWKLKIFSDYISEKVGVLTVGDIIWINLSEEDKNLIVQTTNDRESNYSFKFVHCNPSDRFSDFVGNSNGMFIIENLDMSRGGLVKWSTSYRLKHLTTNKYLSIGTQPAWDIDERKDNSIYSFELVSSDKEAAKFSFEIIYSTISSRNKELFMRYVPKDAYFKLKVESDLWVTYRDVARDSLESKEHYNEDFITLPLICKMKENNIFHCSKSSQTQVIITLFLISCKNTIKNTLKYLDPEFMSYGESDYQQLQLKHKVVTYKLDRMKVCLKQLELFCNNRLLDYLDADQIFGQINEFIQNLLKEQQFIELLAYTLIVCFPKHEFLKELKRTEVSRKERKAKKEKENNISLGDSGHLGSHRSAEKSLDLMSDPKKHGGPADGNSFKSEIIEDINHKKKRICELSYQLIIAICRQNIPNKDHAFPYLPLFQMQAKYIPNSVDCVNMILRDNEEILLNLHKNNPNFQDGKVGQGGHMSYHSYAFKTDATESPAVGLRDKPGVGIKQDSFNLKALQADTPTTVRNPGRKASLIMGTALAETSYKDAYQKYYDKIYKHFQYDLKRVLTGWEPIKFFAALLQKTKDAEKQKKLIYFFKTISLQGAEGININQEIIYKFFTSTENMSNNILNTNLVRVFTTENNKLCVRVPFAPYNDKVYELKEFLETNDGAAEYNPTLFNSMDDFSMLFEGYDVNIFEKVERRSEELLTKHLDLCTALCQSRNYSWKHVLEKEMTWESLLSHLLEDLPADVKASLSRLMSSLYIDQEPRREGAVPLFCKVVDKKRLALIENKKDGNELMTMATSKAAGLEDNQDGVNIDSFKVQLLNQINELKEIMEKLPTETKKDNYFLEKKVEHSWKKAYSSYVLEILQTTLMMLKFNKIKIVAKKINIDPLPKDKDNDPKGKKIAGGKKKNFKLMNLFNTNKGNTETGEFEHIMRAIMMLFEYDHTYPEVKRMLDEQRKEKKKAQEANIFSGKKFFSNIQGIKNLIIDKKSEEKKSKADSEAAERTRNDLDLKQGDVMKSILQNLLGQQEVDIETNIKNKIIDILEYFFDYKHDKLFSNIRRVFYIMINDSDLVAIYRKSSSIAPVRERLQELLQHYIKFIVPRILKTGTMVDDIDLIFKQDSGDDILDINECLDFELLPILFQQLCLTSNAIYEKKILHLMTRMYNQRSEFSLSVKSLLLLFEERNIVNYNRARRLYKTLQKFTEESESWLTSAKVDEKKLNITKEVLLFFFNSIFFSEPEFGGDEEFQPELVFKIPVNKTRQDMHRHLKIYVPVISLLKDNLHIVEDVRDPEILDLFRYCFAYLTAFVRKNETNQKLLANHIVTFMYNMGANLGHVSLLNEIFRDNLTVCIEKAEGVIDDFYRLIQSNGRRAEYLEFFKIIQIVKGEMLYVNQRRVLNLFLEPANKHLMLYFEKPVGGSPRRKRKQSEQAAVEKKNNFNYVNTFSFEKTISSKIYGTTDEPYYYHAKLFELLGMTACGKEGLILNEVRLRSTLDFSYLLELLMEDDDFLIVDTPENQEEVHLPHLNGLLKIPILEYIFFVYVESEKTTLEATKGTYTVKDFVAKERQKLESLTKYKDIYLKYLFENVLRILHWYYKQSRENITEERNEEAKREYTELQHFLDCLLNSLDKFELKKISFRGKTDLHALLSFVQKDRDLGEFDRVIQDLHKPMMSRTTIHTVGFRKAVAEEEIWKQIWEEFVNVFSTSKLLTEEIDKEKKIFAKSLTQIDKMFRKDAVLREIINNEEVTKKFIDFVSNNDSDDDTRDTMVRILDALGNLILNEETEAKMMEKQNFLCRLGAVDMIFSKLSDPGLDKSDAVFKQLVVFAIQMLEGGNENIQASVYEFFTGNEESEEFFAKLHSRFIAETRMVSKLEENPGAKVNEADSEDMKNILRLLQLFAEGHFSDLQNYIRQQTNSYHNFDLLDDISDLLNTYMDAKHTAFFDTMIQCFDTITECIQGPCYENQVAILHGSFPDLASSLFSQDEKVEKMLRQSTNKQLKVNELRSWQLARLKYKCSITLLSLLEARQDDQNVNHMMKSLPIEALRMNVTDIYLMFKAQYNGEYSNKVFQHFNNDPDEDHTEEYCSLIIETGFNLFFLLNIFAETKLAALDFAIEEEQVVQVKDNIFIKWFKFLQLILILIYEGIMKIFTICKKKKEEIKEEVLLSQIVPDPKMDVRTQENLITSYFNQERTRTWKEASRFYKRNSASIEIQREKKLEKTYFYLPPFCRAITKDTKAAFTMSANRATPESKCADLLKEAPRLIETIKYEAYLQSIYKRITVLSLLTDNILLWRDTAFLLAIAINLVVVVSYTRDDTAYGYFTSVPGTITNLGVGLLVLSLFIVFYFMVKTAPILVKKAWKDTPKDKLTIPRIIINSGKSVYYLLGDFYVLYYCMYGVSAIIGLAYTPFFFSVHLLDVLVRFPLLQSVLHAIWVPRRSLMLTFLLYQLLNYAFSLWGYYYFYEDYQGYCWSTWICFLTAIDKSFKVDGGIGGFLSFNADVGIGRFIYDNLYNLFVMIIMLNIVSGIIIDNFGTLREEEKEFRFDIQNICYICGHNREELEKASNKKNNHRGMGFTNHIRKEHYLWNYLFYIAYIQEKEKTEYTGLESYIVSQIQEGETSWFPIGKAMITEGDGGDEEEGSGLEPLAKLQEEQKALMKDTELIARNITNLDEMVKNYESRRVTASSKQPATRTMSSGAANLFDGHATISKILHGNEHRGQHLLQSPDKSSNVNLSDIEDEEHDDE